MTNIAFRFQMSPRRPAGTRQMPKARMYPATMSCASDDDAPSVVSIGAMATLTFARSRIVAIATAMQTMKAGQRFCSVERVSCTCAV
jgi:hypothetical protein